VLKAKLVAQSRLPKALKRNYKNGNETDKQVLALQGKR
jgi:hypothetical protein